VRAQDEQTLRAIMIQGGGWIGLPALRFQGQILDGQRRIAIAQSYGWTVPELEPRNWREVARHLILVGHHDRAVRFLKKHGALRVDRDLLAILRVPRTQYAPTIAAWKFLQGHPGTTRGRKERESARIVRRLRLLVTEVEERGVPATLAELRTALYGYGHGISRQQAAR
jgi:hypothetical protein